MSRGPVIPSHTFGSNIPLTSIRVERVNGPPADGGARNDLIPPPHANAVPVPRRPVVSHQDALSPFADYALDLDHITPVQTPSLLHGATFEERIQAYNRENVKLIHRRGVYPPCLHLFFWPSCRGVSSSC